MVINRSARPIVNADLRKGKGMATKENDFCLESAVRNLGKPPNAKDVYNILDHLIIFPGVEYAILLPIDVVQLDIFRYTLCSGPLKSFIAWRRSKRGIIYISAISMLLTREKKYAGIYTWQLKDSGKLTMWSATSYNRDYGGWGVLQIWIDHFRELKSQQAKGGEEIGSYTP